MASSDPEPHPHPIVSSEDGSPNPEYLAAIAQADLKRAKEQMQAAMLSKHPESIKQAATWLLAATRELKALQDQVQGKTASPSPTNTRGALYRRQQELASIFDQVDTDRSGFATRIDLENQISRLHPGPELDGLLVILGHEAGIVLSSEEYREYVHRAMAPTSTTPSSPASPGFDV
eukprot:TRINITY_DN11842_c0_g3_i4.p1 TRINITY_DN11842_c0_g3~~TRINITY_DN11842_c0_g3_i4.p1  ORF type:complete len:176 (+),score=36.36 TRINITY_DN11842_c0_g3_i4:267-794(+)